MKQIPSDAQIKKESMQASRSSKGIKKQKQTKSAASLQSAFVSGDNLLHAVKQKLKANAKDRAPLSRYKDEDGHQEKKEMDPSNVTPNLVKLFNEQDLFLDQNKISLDMRLPSTRLMQDNMLTTLRLLNCHPFAPILRIQEVSKDNISLDDLPTAIKQNVICSTDHFSHLMNLIFKKSADRLHKLHQNMREIVDREKAKFIRESHQEVTNGLLALQDAAERKEMLRECGLLDSAVVEEVDETAGPKKEDSELGDQQQHQDDSNTEKEQIIEQTKQSENESTKKAKQMSLRIDLKTEDADKVLKLRRLLACKRY